MRFRFFMALITAVALPAFLLAGHGHKGRHSGVSINVNEDVGDDHVVDCSDVEVTFDGEEGIRDEQTMQIPATGMLEVSLEQRGGARIHGSTDNAFNVRLCKVAAPDAPGGAAFLRDVRLSLGGRKLTVVGPDSDKWLGYLLIDAPRAASLRVDASHAPISFHQVSGTFEARAVNGPISVKGSDGSISARTTNGPISFAGSQGDVKLSAVNGPMSVKLSDSMWRGAGLVATTSNGPVSLKLPNEFRSTVQITGSHGPWSCKGDFCNEVGRTDDGLRTITVGSGEPVVRISTTNGPVSIKSN